MRGEGSPAGLPYPTSPQPLPGLPVNGAILLEVLDVVIVDFL